MTELVPFQEKRKKQFPESVTAKQAVEIELKKYFTYQYPAIEFGKATIKLVEDAETLDKQIIEELPSFDSFTECIAYVTSPTLLDDATIGWTINRLEVPMLLLVILSRGITKKPYLMLPKPYQKMLKRIYTSATTFDRIAEFLSSKKRAKKYLRILQKRLGIFSERKPPFMKAKNGAPLI